MRERVALSLLLLFSSSLAVKRQDFKTCEQSAFCKRHRAISSNTGYQVDWTSIEKETTQVKATLSNGDTRLQLTVTGLTEGRLRVQIDEPKETAIRQRYIPTQALDGEPEQLAFDSVVVNGDHVEIVNGDNQAKAIIHRSPFVIDLFNGDGELVTQINAGGKLKVDMFTTRKDGVQYPAGFWEEKFRTWTDTKPYGSSSVGVDVTMVGFTSAFGLPEHADSFALKSTLGSTDPYRLFNTDVFEYEIGNPMTLYASVPYLLAHRKEATAGVMWLNAAETWVDTQSTESSKGLFRKMWNTVVPDESVPNFTAHFMSESGLVDVFFFSGPTPHNVQSQLAKTAGVTPLPPLFSLGYHQSRWNYRDQKDVAEVNEKFDEYDIPMDVLWLDIEHTDGKKYFTWHPFNFPRPKEMVDGVAAKGRQMVTIIDPHIKKDPNYVVYKDAEVMELYVKRSDNRTDYDGNCWPGASKYLDFFKPKTREYWISQFAFDKYEGSTENLYTWNDMNEPSVFSGPEATMDRDAIHHGGMEHREVHNIYGLQYTSATFEGLLARTGGVDRPFVLSRSGFIGTQRTAAIWTGDNAAEWSHLEISAPMTLSLSIAGIPFVGADIGGYFKNPSEELHVRWFAVGAWQPFFRAHSHIETRRREPWLASEQGMQQMRRVIRERYALLPYWYAAFREHSQTGLPPMRPIFYEFPREEKFFATQDAWMIGSALLVHPVVTEGATSVRVSLPERDGDKAARWYDYHSGAAISAGQHTLPAPLYNAPTPVWQRGGTIVPTWQRVRRSAWLMRADPITLIVALDANGEATGSVYMDDAKTHAYRHGEFVAFRTLGSIGISGGRILIRYLRLHLDADKLEEIERVINEEKTEKEKLERKFESAKKENEARLRREEEEEKQIERLREEEDRRQREEEERVATLPRLQMSIPDRLPAGPAPVSSEGGWAFDSPFVAPPPSSTLPPLSTVSHSSAPAPLVSPVRSARIEALEALLQNVNQDLNSGSGSSAIVDTVAQVGRIPVRSVNDILSAGRMETEENTEPLPERCERRAVYFKRETPIDKTKEEELGDEFFELTVDDLKNIQKGHRDVVRNQTQRALLPRSTLEERNKERKLSAWKHVVIRFKLPNEMIIQGCFLPHEPASHLYEFLASLIDAPFTLRFVTTKIGKDEKKSLVAMDLAPKATLAVSCGQVSINAEAARFVTEEEAEENSREWLSANSSYVPYAPTVDPEPSNLAQKRAADKSPTSQRRSIPESLPSGPKWLKKK